MEKLHKRKKTSVGDTIFVICNTLFMILFVLITLYPILNTVAISLNDGTDALRGGIYLLPRKFTWKNYLTVLQKDNLLTGAYVSVARTVVGTLLALIANAILAFIVSRKHFLFKKTVVTILGYYHVCKRWHDSNIPAVQKPGNDKQFLGLCNSWYVQCL